MTSNLVQVGSTLYVCPGDVVKIYQTSERPGGLVYVVTRGGLMGDHLYRNTDWSIEMVRAALGLVDSTDFYRAVFGG